MTPSTPVVLMTRHVEEIPPGFTHALVMRDGALTASGPLAETVTASALSHTFDIAVELDVTRGRYRARSTTH
ncbi:MAG: hypothetical protein KDB09_08045 [Acidimicrobiales bacterium]|nr:hypothetical protein [Acidimicrobiales bacterium]